MKTLLVINEMSGNSGKTDADAVRCICAKGDDTDTVKLISEGQDYDVDGYEKIIVCGGDGTLNVALNKCKNKSVYLYYIPTGTLNERAKSNNKERLRKKACKINDELFSYVAACGSFTEIAYKAKTKNKKKYKVFAYLFKVIAAYKVYDIEAEIEAGDKKYSGHYSLIMAIDSNRCFGFDFNKCYRDGEDDFHLLLIKTTGKNNLIGKIRMFFPFFRAFFIGFKEEYHSKNIDFMPVSDVKIELKKEQIFCIDGEKREKSGTLSISETELLPKFFVLSKK